ALAYACRTERPSRFPRTCSPGRFRTRGRPLVPWPREGRHAMAASLSILNSIQLELIRISVVGGKLIMPRKSHRIYHKPGGVTPGKPSQVVWLVFGLGEHQTVTITSKNGAAGPMATAYGPVTTANNPVYSGPPAGIGKWWYDVELFE